MRRSESLYGHLVRSDGQSKLDWSISQNNLAQALAATGRLEDAAKYFARAVNTQRRILQSFHNKPTARTDNSVAFDAGVNEQAGVERQLATTLNNLGMLLADSIASGEAEQSYLEAISLLQSDRQSHDDIIVKQQLATVLSNLSGLLAKESPDRATEYARQALAQQTHALESDPGNAKLATQVIVTLNTLGASQSAAGQPTAATETFTRAVEIGNQLLARWPDQPTYRRDLVVSLNHLGLAYCKTGKLTQARRTLEMALTHGRPLAKTFATDAEIQSMLGGVLNNLGFFHQQLGNSSAAAATYGEAISAQSLAVRLAPEVKRYRQYLRKHQENHRTVVRAGSAS